MAALNLPESMGYPDIEGERIKVRATQMGEYEYMRRREGDVFTLKPRMITLTTKGRIDMDEHSHPKMRLLTAEEQFSPRWMERVDVEEMEMTTGAQVALSRATEDING